MKGPIAGPCTRARAVEGGNGHFGPALAWTVKRQADAKKKADEKKAADEKPAAMQPAQSALPAPAGAAPKRNGYDDDGSEDPRNAGVVEDYAYDDAYSQVA